MLRSSFFNGWGVCRLEMNIPRLLFVFRLLCLLLVDGVGRGRILIGYKSALFLS
jgi:hypothetical protein